MASPFREQFHSSCKYNYSARKVNEPARLVSCDRTANASALVACVQYVLSVL